MLSEDTNQSVVFSIGFLFTIAYGIYFFMFPIFYLFFEGGEWIDNLISIFYTNKGLWFLTYKSIYYSLTGLVFFLVGYISFLKNEDHISKKLYFFKKKIPFRNILISAIILFSGGLLSKILGILKGAHLHNHYWSAVSDNQMINFLLYFNVLQILSLILVYYGYLVAKKERNIFWKKVFFVISMTLFTIMLLATFIHGGKALTLGIIFPMLVLYSYSFSFKKSVIIFLLMGLSIVLVMSGKILIEGYATENSDVNSKPIQSLVETFIGRVNQTHITTEIFTRQDEYIGFKIFGEFYEHAKPVQYRENIIQNGNEFAQDYGFISVLDNATGVGRTVIGGLYIAFGYIGIILGMLFLGFLYKIIFWLNKTDFGIIFYSFTLLNLLLRIEQDLFYVILTVLFHFSIVFAVYIAAMEGGIMDKFFSFFKKNIIV